jgi:gamma-glutamyltranspeptidase/glutathione hydrolase
MTLVAQVAAGHPDTVAAGLEVLRAGGRAVDAAVAASLAAFAAEPLLASAGGGGMLLASTPGEPVRCYDFFPRVPGLGGAETTERDFRAIEIDFGETTQVFHVGRASACVPTVLEGLAAAVHESGRLRLDQVAAPAIALSRRGARVGPSGAEVFGLLWPILSIDPESRRQLAGGDERPSADSLLHNEAYAALLEDWARDGQAPEGFRRAILAAHGEAVGGCITPQDMEAAAPTVTEAATIELDEWRLHGTYRPGALAVERMMRELFIAPRPDEAHLALAIARAAVRADALKHDPTVRGSTTHISVSDSEGQVASVTLSNGEGSGYLLRDYGVQLNNFLGEEDLNPAGFFHHPAGADLPTMMAPTIVTHAQDGRVVAVGSGGANRIRSAVTRVLEALIRTREGLEAAVRAPRVHAEGDTVWFERAGWEDLDRVEAVLREHFATVVPFDERAFFFGGVHSVAHSGRSSAGVGDARRGGLCRTP